MCKYTYFVCTAASQTLLHSGHTMYAMSTIHSMYTIVLSPYLHPYKYTYIHADRLLLGFGVWFSILGQIGLARFGVLTLCHFLDLSLTFFYVSRTCFLLWFRINFDDFRACLDFRPSLYVLGWG